MYILVISPLSDVKLAKIFSHSVGGLFNLKTISFVVQKLFNCMQSYLSIPSLSYWATWVLLRKYLPMPIASSVSPALSFTSFKLSGLILISTLSGYFYMVTGMEVVSVFCMQIYSFPSNICWRGCLFSIVCFWHICQKWGRYSCVDSYPVLYSVSLVFMFVFMPVPCCFYCYGSVV
jgi:hypothetical protein